MTYGVFNTETRELFQFNTYKEAYKGYLMLLVDSIASENPTLTPEWFIVYIEDGKIVQFQNFVWNHHSKKVDIKDLDDPTPWYW